MPEYEGRKFVIACKLEWALWEQEKASFTNISQPSDNFFAKLRVFLVSSSWKRTFSSRRISLAFKLVLISKAS